MLHTVVREMEVTHYGTNADEESLCENAENRVGTIFDYVRVLRIDNLSNHRGRQEHDD